MKVLNTPEHSMTCRTPGDFQLIFSGSISEMKLIVIDVFSFALRTISSPEETASISNPAVLSR